MATFKEEHEALQHIVRELTLVRQHNLGFKQGGPQQSLLHFAEDFSSAVAAARARTDAERKAHEDVEREQREAEEAERRRQEGVVGKLKGLVVGAS